MVGILHEATRRSGRARVVAGIIIVARHGGWTWYRGHNDGGEGQGDALVILLGKRQVLGRYSNNLRRGFLIT